MQKIGVGFFLDTKQWNVAKYVHKKQASSIERGLVLHDKIMVPKHSHGAEGTSRESFFFYACFFGTQSLKDTFMI